MKDKKTNQKIAITATVIGLADSVYLTVEKLTQNQSMCLPGIGDCWSVSTSIYSEVFGIPVSLFGVLAYILILGLLVRNENSFLSGTVRDQLFFGVTLAGFVYSIYLTYLEIAVIKAVCPFCVISAVMMTILFVCSLIRLVQNQSDLTFPLEDKNG